MLRPATTNFSSKTAAFEKMSTWRRNNMLAGRVPVGGRFKLTYGRPSRRMLVGGRQKPSSLGTFNRTYGDAKQPGAKLQFSAAPTRTAKTRTSNCSHNELDADSGSLIFSQR